MNLIPSRAWWLTPSGGPYERPGSLWTILSEAPLPAHTGGAVLAVLIEHYVSGLTGFPLWLGAMILMGVWQAAKWNDEVYGATWVREIFWRLVIGGLGALPVVWIFRQ